MESRQNNLYFHNGNNQDLFNLFGILLDQNKKIRDKNDVPIDLSVKEFELLTYFGE